MYFVLHLICLWPSIDLYHDAWRFPHDSVDSSLASRYLLLRKHADDDAEAKIEANDEGSWDKTSLGYRWFRVF